jgi:hypothetical protein
MEHLDQIQNIYVCVCVCVYNQNPFSVTVHEGQILIYIVNFGLKPEKTW